LKNGLKNVCETGTLRKYVLSKGNSFRRIACPTQDHYSSDLFYWEQEINQKRLELVYREYIGGGFSLYCISI